ncbi:MAG TPA: hypothetical protein VJV22_10115 [Acidobacteriaceae bacterium]|nr:hypothetical protein [Acidobacteriaceae bacterium]
MFNSDRGKKKTSSGAAVIQKHHLWHENEAIRDEGGSGRAAITDDSGELQSAGLAVTMEKLHCRIHGSAGAGN